jgi:hypothetical protein
MKYAHLSKRYITLLDGEWGSVVTLEGLDERFCEFRKWRPTIYTDFRKWIDSLVEMNVLIPF